MSDELRATIEASSAATAAHTRALRAVSAELEKQTNLAEQLGAPMSTPPPVPTEPLANKAVVAAIGSIVTVLLRWAVSGEFSLNDEGLITLAGAITTVGVYAVSNFRRILGLKGERGQASPISVLLWLLVAVVIVLLIAWLLGHV